MAAARSNSLGCATDIFVFLRLTESGDRFVTIRSGSCSKLVRGAESAPVPAIDADRYVDLAHHDGVAVAHIPRVAPDQIGAQVAAGGEAGRIIEDTAIAAVGGVPGDIARSLRVRVDLVVHRQVAVAV